MDTNRLTAFAGMVIVNLQRAHISPVYSPQSALVYNANGNDVDTVIIGGEVLVRDGRTVNINEVSLIADCQRAAEAMWSRAGIKKLDADARGPLHRPQGQV